jgi:pimeloyl-ACP methyl ester carboxylesterase
MTPEEFTLELADGMRLAALAWGPEDGERVLALHGWLDNAASFARLAPRLEGIRTVALDLPGHGLSDHFPRGWVHHFIDWVPVVLAAVDALGWERLSLVGHSMGAGISSLVASVAPDRVRRMVLIEGLGPLSGSAEGAPERVAAALADEADLVHRADRGPHPDLRSAILARMRGTELDEDTARLLVERGVTATSDGVRFRHDPRLKLRSRLRMTEDQVRAFLAAIRCPVLAVRASHGFPFPPDDAQARLERIPDCRTLEVEGDHHVHLTSAERIARPVADFLTE